MLVAFLSPRWLGLPVALLLSSTTAASAGAAWGEGGPEDAILPLCLLFGGIVFAISRNASSGPGIFRRLRPPPPERTEAERKAAIEAFLDAEPETGDFDYSRPS